MESTPLSENYNYCYSGIVGYHQALDYVIQSKANTEELYLALHKAAKDALFAISESKDQDNLEFNIKLDTENISKDDCINVSVIVSESRKEIVFIGTQTKKKQLTPVVAEPRQLPNSSIVDDTQETQKYAKQNVCSDDKVDEAPSPENRTVKNATSEQSCVHIDSQKAQNISEQSVALNATSVSSCIKLCTTVSYVNIGNKMKTCDLSSEQKVVISEESLENTKLDAHLDDKVDMSKSSHIILFSSSSVLNSKNKTEACEPCAKDTQENEKCTEQNVRLVDKVEKAPSPVPTPAVQVNQDIQKCSKQNVHQHDRVDALYAVYKKNKKETCEQASEPCAEDIEENHKCSKQNMYLHDRVDASYVVYKKNKKETCEQASEPCAEDIEENHKCRNQNVYLHDRVDASYVVYKKNKKETCEQASEPCAEDTHENHKCSNQKVYLHKRVEASYSAASINKKVTCEQASEPCAEDTQENHKCSKQNVYLHKRVEASYSATSMNKKVTCEQASEPCTEDTHEIQKCSKHNVHQHDRVGASYAVYKKNKKVTCEQASEACADDTQENQKCSNQKVYLHKRVEASYSAARVSKKVTCEQASEPCAEDTLEIHKCSKENVYLHERVEASYSAARMNKKVTCEQANEPYAEDTQENHKCSKQKVYLQKRVEASYSAARMNRKETCEQASEPYAEDTQENHKCSNKNVRLEDKVGKGPSLVPTVEENQENQKCSKQKVYLHDRVEPSYSAYRKNKKETCEQAYEPCAEDIQKNEKYTKQNLRLNDKVAKAPAPVPTVKEKEKNQKFTKQNVYLQDKVEASYAACRKNKKDTCEQSCGSVQRSKRIQSQPYGIKTTEQCTGLSKDVVSKRIRTQHERILESSFELNQSIKQLKKLHQYLYSRSNVKSRCSCQSIKSEDQELDIQATKRLCELNATLAKTNFHVLTNNEDNASPGPSICKPYTHNGAKKPDIYNDHSNTNPRISITKKPKYTSSNDNKNLTATHAAEAAVLWNPMYKSSYYEMDYLGNVSSDISLKSKVSQTEITNNDVINMAKILMKRSRCSSLTSLTLVEEDSFERMCRNRDKTYNFMYGNNLKKFDRLNYTPNNRSKSAPFMLNNVPKIRKSTQELMDLLTHNLDGIIEMPKDINDTGFIYRPTKMKGVATNTGGCVTIFQATNLKYNELLIHKILSSKSTSFPIVTDVQKEADESDGEEFVKRTSISEIKIPGKRECVSNDLLSVGIQTSLPMLTCQEHLSESSAASPTVPNNKLTQAFLTTMSSLEFVSSEDDTDQPKEMMEFPKKNNLKEPIATVSKQASLFTWPYVKDEATSSTTLTELQWLETKPTSTLPGQAQKSFPLYKVLTDTAIVLDNEVVNVPLRGEKIYHVSEQCCTPTWMATNENYVYELDTNFNATKMSLESLSSENCTPIVSEIIKVENKVTHPITTQTSRPSCLEGSAIMFNNKGTFRARKTHCQTNPLEISENVSYESCTSSGIGKKRVTNTSCDLIHTRSSTAHTSESRCLTDFGIMCGAPIIIARCTNDEQTNLSLIDNEAYQSKNHVINKISDMTIQTSRSDYCNDSGTMCDTPATLSTCTDITLGSSLSMSLHRRNNDCRAAVYNDKVQQSSIRTSQSNEAFTCKSEHDVDSGTICDHPMSISTSTDDLDTTSALSSQAETIVQSNAIPTTLRKTSTAVQEENTVKTQIRDDWVETGTMCDSANIVSTSRNVSITKEIFQHTSTIPAVSKKDAIEGRKATKSIPHIFHEKKFYNGNTITSKNISVTSEALLSSSVNLQRKHRSVIPDRQVTDSSSQTSESEHWFDPEIKFETVDNIFDKSNVSSFNNDSNLLLIKRIEYLVVKDKFQTQNKSKNVRNRVTQTSSTMSDIPATKSTATNASDSNGYSFPNADVKMNRKTSQCLIDHGTMYEIDTSTTMPKHINSMKTSTSTLSALEDTSLVLRNATKSRPVTQSKYWSEETALCDLSIKYSALINKTRSSMSFMSTGNQSTTNDSELPVKPFTSIPDFDSKCSPTDSFILFKDKNKNTNKLKVLNQLDYSGVKIFIAKTEKDGEHRERESNKSDIHVINLSELKDSCKNNSSDFVEAKEPMLKCSKGIMVIPRKSVTIVDHKDQENKLPKSISSILKKQMPTDFSIRPTNLKKQEEQNSNNQLYKNSEETNIISNKHAAIDIKTIDSTFYKFLENYVDNCIKEKMKALNINTGRSHSQTETSSSSSHQTRYSITNTSQSKSSKKLMKYIQNKSSLFKFSKTPKIRSKTSIKTVSNIYENLNVNTMETFLSPDKYDNLQGAENVQVLRQCPHTGEVREFNESGKYGKILETKNERKQFDSKPKYPEPFFIVHRCSSSDINIAPKYKESSFPLKLMAETDYYFETGKLVKNLVQCTKVYKPIKYSVIRKQILNLSMTGRQSAHSNCGESLSNIKTCRSRHKLNTELYNKTKSSLDVTITHKRTGLEQKAKSENISTNHSLRRSYPCFGSTTTLKQTRDLDSFDEENGETSNYNQEINSLLSSKYYKDEVVQNSTEETDPLANNSGIHQNNLNEVIPEHLPSTSETGKNRVKHLWKWKRNLVNPENTNTIKDKSRKNNQESSHNSKTNNIPESKIYYFKTIKSMPTESDQLFDYYKFREVKYMMNDNHSKADFERIKKIEEMNLLLLENNDLYANSRVKKFLTEDCNRINANLKAVNKPNISSVVQKGNFTLENDGRNLSITTEKYCDTIKYDTEEILKNGSCCDDVIHQRHLLDSSEATPSDDTSSAASRLHNASNKITVNKEENDKLLKSDYHTEVADIIYTGGSSSVKIHNTNLHLHPCKTVDLLKRKHYYKVMNARTMSKDELAQKDNKKSGVHSDTLHLTSNIRRNHNSLEQIMKHKPQNEKQLLYSSACDTKAAGNDQNGDFMIKSCQQFLESNISPDVKVQTEHISTTFGKEMNKLKREIVNSQSSLNYLKKLEDMETSMRLSVMAAQTIQVANNQFKEAVQNICESSSGTKSFHNRNNDDTVLKSQTNLPSIHPGTNPDDIVLQATSLLANYSSRLLDMVNASMLSVKKLMNESLFGKTTSPPSECVDTNINVDEHVCPGESLTDNFKTETTTNVFSHWTPAPVEMEVFPKINYDKCKDPLFPEIGQLEKINQIEEKLTLNIMKKEFLQRKPECSIRCHNDDTVIEDAFSDLLVTDDEIHNYDKELPESYDSMNSFELRSINEGQYINKNVFNIALRHKIETHILLIQKEILKFYILLLNYSLSDERNILVSLNEEAQRLLDSLLNTLQEVMYQADKWSHPNISKFKELATNILSDFTLSFILPEVEEELCLSDQAKSEMYSTVLRTVQLMYSKLQDLLGLCYSLNDVPVLLSKSEGAVGKSTQNETAHKKNMSQGVICVHIKLVNGVRGYYSEESLTGISDESQSLMQDDDRNSSYTDDSDNVTSRHALTNLKVADLKHLIIKQCDSNENEDLDNFLEKEISNNDTSTDNEENFSDCKIEEPKMRTRSKYKTTTMSSLITDLFKENSDCCNVESVDRVCIVTDDVSKDVRDGVDVDVLFKSIRGIANDSDVHLSAVDVNRQSDDNVDAYLQECINSAIHQLLKSDEKNNSKKLRNKTKDLNQPETSGTKKSAQIKKSNNTPASAIDTDANEAKKLKITFNKKMYMLDVESGLMAVKPPNLNLNAYDKHQEKSKSKSKPNIQKPTNLQLRNIYSSTEISILNNLRKNT